MSYDGWFHYFPEDAGAYWFKENAMAEPICLELHREVGMLEPYQDGEEYTGRLKGGWWSKWQDKIPSFDARMAGE